MEWCEAHCAARGLHAASALEGLGPGVLRVAIGRLIGLRLPGVPSALVVAVLVRRGRQRRVVRREERLERPGRARRSLECLMAWEPTQAESPRPPRVNESEAPARTRI